MKEYSIKFTNQTLSLFKTSKTIRELKVQGCYIEATTDKFPSHFSLLKERLQHYPSKVYSFGIPVKDLYVGRIFHTKQEIHLSPVNNMYYFNEKLHSKTQKQISNFAMKSLSKEELEHRKRNINYLLKKNEHEETVDMKYVNDKPVTFDFAELERKEVKTVDEKEKNRKIRLSILRVKMVNIGELVKVSKLSIDKVIEIVSEMCVKYNGRYLLKTKFYPQELRERRENILNLFKDCEMIKCCIREEKDLMLIKEICTRENNFYKLKGYKEEIELTSKIIDYEKVIEEKGIISLQLLSQILSCEEEEVKDMVFNNKRVVMLINNTFVVRKTDNPKDLRNIVIDLLKKQDFLKRKEITQAYHDITGEEPNIFNYNKVMKEFCINKGINWVIKK